MVTAAAPASWTRRASSGALRDASLQPARIFTVTGIFTALVMASMTLAACAGSRIRLQPALCLAILGTGQPMLTSTMSAPMPSTIWAAAAIFAGSPPKIWIETGRSSSVYSAYSSVRSMPRTSPSEDTISVTTRPQPPCRLTRRRKAVSVIPAIGATTNGEGRLTLPIFMDLWRVSTGRVPPDVPLVRSNVGSIDLDAHRLSDQIDGQDQPRLVVLTHEPAVDSLERAVDDFDHHPFADHRARVIRQVGFDKLPNPVDLVLRNRRGLALKRDDVDDACALQDRQTFHRIESREAVPGEQRPVDFFLAILPAAPLGHRRQEHVDLLLLKLFAHDLLVARTRPERKPTYTAFAGRDNHRPSFDGRGKVHESSLRALTTRLRCLPELRPPHAAARARRRTRV